MRGMSMKMVADKAGLSIAMLSQVERGQTAPSIKSLRAICEALEMPVKWLFETGDAPVDEDAEFVVRADARREISYDDGALLKELLTPDTQPSIQMLRFVIQPGTDSGEPYSNAEGGKCGYILSGQLWLKLGERHLVLNAGDSFAFPATTMVRFGNDATQPCEVLWIVSPPTV